MTGKVGLRLRQAAAVGVLAGFVVGGSMVSANAAESAAPRVINLKPGDSFTLHGSRCTFDGQDESKHPGVVVVGLVDVRDLEKELPRVTFLPNYDEADKEGDWSVTNAVPVAQPNGDYVAVPVCEDPGGDQNSAFGIEESAAILQVRAGTTTGTQPPVVIDPPEIVIPPSVPAAAKTKPIAVKTSPKFTG